jgi:SAM-dependent methyltransferase
VIESWNIFHELLAMPVVAAAFSQKEAIRILDIGSGTGGAVIGFLLALRSWGRCAVPVEITSIDVNEDALNKQKTILEAIASSLPFEISFELRLTSLPFDLESFVPSFASVAAAAGPRYDVVTSWKCLCEFYNVNFAQAQGIVRHTLDLASKMLVPYGLFVAADVTTRDNDYEFFSMTLNREANEHDNRRDAVARTILPVPCAKNSPNCSEKKCFTQRRFSVNHQFVSADSTKIAYRVLAPVDFAKSIISGFRAKPAFRVNAARPQEACRDGKKIEIAGSLPCGYTGFF